MRYLRLSICFACWFVYFLVCLFILVFVCLFACSFASLFASKFAWFFKFRQSLKRPRSIYQYINILP